jgi:hypothetical protein
VLFFGATNYVVDAGYSYLRGLGPKVFEFALAAAGYHPLMARTPRRIKERDLYRVIQRWAERHFGCFATAVNKGTSYGRVDVVGLRQVPGERSAETDVICIEVKRGTQPLLNAMGQAAGYSVYGDFSYLADFRPTTGFSDTERDLADKLGIGLIRVRSMNRVELVSTARRQDPVLEFKLQVADQLGYVACTICETYFPRNWKSRQKYGWDNLVRDQKNRARIERSISDGRGLVFWPVDASANDRTHNVRHEDGSIYNRRFVCNTCARLFFGSQSELQS